MSAISQLLLALFWRNFKGTFIQTDSNRHYGICPGNICPGNICPYREYLCSNWPPFDQTLKVGSWDHLNGFLLSQWHWSRHHMSWQHLSISGISHLLLTQFWPNFLETIFCRPYLFFINIFCDKISFDPNFFGPKQFLDLTNYFGQKKGFFGTNNFINPKFFGPILFWEQKFFRKNIFFGPNTSLFCQPDDLIV